MGTTVRAWRVHRLGSPAQALELDHLAGRGPGPGEVRVAVEAVGLNFPDLLLCSGRYQERPSLPFSPGYEAAGAVIDCGDGVLLTPGQRVVVVPELPNGALQDCLTVPQEQVYPVPSAMPPTVAAVLHIAYQTAHVALHHRAGLRVGETLMVTGAAGGVGMAAVQLGAAAGARVVAVVTGEEKAQACRGWGAAATVDLEVGDWEAQVRDAVGPGGVDVALDVVGGGLLDCLRHNMAFEGRLVVVGLTSGEIRPVPANHALLRNYSLVGLHLALYRRRNPALLRQVHRELVALWERGAIRPAIDAVLPFGSAPEGLALIAERRVTGRVVLEV